MWNSAGEYLKEMENAQLLVMDAHHIQLEASFDVILCLQNGLSAMKVEPMEYVKEVMALLSADGKAFFSSYSPNFWEQRVAWFQEQAEKGLLGENRYGRNQRRRDRLQRRISGNYPLAGGHGHDWQGFWIWVSGDRSG